MGSMDGIIKEKSFSLGLGPNGLTYTTLHRAYMRIPCILKSDVLRIQ